jgi:hypothetical protein
MAYEAGTASNHADLFDKLRTFLKSGPVGWTELFYTGVAPATMFFEAPGLSGTEEIHVGFQLYESPGSDTFGFYGWQSQSYDAGLAILAQPGHSGTRFHSTWDASIPYWFFGNGQRVIVVTKISTVYTASYLGKFLPYGTAGEYGLPYYLGMNWSSAIRFSSINEGVRNFWDPGLGALMLQPSGNWHGVTNFYEVSSAESWPSTSNYVYPFAAGYSDTHSRFRELRDNVDGSYPLFPLVLCGNNPTTDIYGELDGAFATSGFSLASEDTLTIGGDTYRVFQNVFRTTRYNYCAIKQA